MLNDRKKQMIMIPVRWRLSAIHNAHYISFETSQSFARISGAVGNDIFIIASLDHPVILANLSRDWWTV